MLIGMITQSFIDMGPFLVVLFIGVIAFADAFSSIRERLIQEKLMEPLPEVPEDATVYMKYVDQYAKMVEGSYLSGLGEFIPDKEFYEAEDWFVFFLSTAFNLIVLFNLLIAIVSETFAGQWENKNIYTYKETVKQIEDMQSSLYGTDKAKAKYEPMKMVLVAQAIDAQELHEQEEEADPMDEIKERLDNLENGRMAQMETKLDLILSKLSGKDSARTK